MESNFKKEKMFGPFIRSNESDKWHFCKQCTNYPAISNPEIRVASYEPEKTELCSECVTLEKHE